MCVLGKHSSTQELCRHPKKFLDLQASCTRHPHYIQLSKENLMVGQDTLSKGKTQAKAFTMVSMGREKGTQEIKVGLAGKVVFPAWGR